MFKTRSNSHKKPTTKLSKPKKTRTITSNRTTQRRTNATTTTNTSTTTTTKPPPPSPLLAIPLDRIIPPLTKTNNISVNVLKLPRCSPLMMLHIEERLLRHDPQKRNFVILNRPLPHHNSVVLGVSGKPAQLVNIPLVIEDNIPLIKRFTGGGTVYITSDVRFAGLVMNKSDIPHVEPYPTPIMKWTAELYEDCITSLREKSHNEFIKFNKKRPTENLFFSLYENDYCLVAENSIAPINSANTTTISDVSSNNDTNLTQIDPTHSTTTPISALKFAGNAQSFIRERIVHHTSILWDLDIDNISKYLTLPNKRPAYRQSRSHRDFLTDLRPLFDVKTKLQNIDYFDDFLIEDDGVHIGGCAYTSAYTISKNQLLALQAKSSALTQEYIAETDPNNQNSPDEQARTARYKAQKAELEVEMAQIQFPNLYSYVNQHLQRYKQHSSMLMGMGGVNNVEDCQFNDNFTVALNQHFNVNFTTLDDIKDIIDVADGNLGTYIIPPH